MRDKSIVIAGGGMIGLTMACALLSKNIKSTVIDSITPEEQANNINRRTTALSASSVNLFKNLDLWDYIAPHASPILDIRVSEANIQGIISPFFIHYDHKMVGSPFGYVVENRFIIQALQKYKIPHIQARIRSIQRTESWIEITHDRGTIKSHLLIGADGRFSTVRKLAKIPTITYDYQQKAIVCTVAHERSHQGIAVELFLPDGPFAMIPMSNNKTNIIFSNNAQRVDRLMQEQDFLWSILENIFGHWLGKLTLASDIVSYPLALSLATRYVEKRIVIIGDAAHTIHPIAGQGFNLGLRDVAALTEILSKKLTHGLDPGSNLEEFQNWRTFDIISLVTVCHVLLKVFSNNNPILRLSRNTAFVAVQSMPIIKKYFIRHAMGLLGNIIPTLLKRNSDSH